jgi:hypothetical protein
MFSTTLALLSQIEHETAYLCTSAKPYMSWQVSGQMSRVNRHFAEHFNASLLSRGSDSDVRAFNVFAQGPGLSNNNK